MNDNPYLETLSNQTTTTPQVPVDSSSDKTSNPYLSTLSSSTTTSQSTPAPDTKSNPYLETLSSTKTDTPTKGVILAGADPQDVQWAKNHMTETQYNGWCMSFVADATGSSYKGNAIDNWYESPNKVEGTLEGIQPGDRIYFKADSSNGNYGHVGLYEGNNKFISATYGGVKEKNLDDWIKETGQQPLGYVPITN